METADYGVLHAKRIMAVINLIAANGKMVCALPMEKVSALWSHALAMRCTALRSPVCILAMCACVCACVCLCVYSLLANTSPASGCGSA